MRQARNRTMRNVAGNRRGRHAEPLLPAASCAARIPVAAFTESQPTCRASALSAPSEERSEPPCRDLSTRLGCGERPINGAGAPGTMRGEPRLNIKGPGVVFGAGWLIRTMRRGKAPNVTLCAWGDTRRTAKPGGSRFPGCARRAMADATATRTAADNNGGEAVTANIPTRAGNLVTRRRA